MSSFNPQEEITCSSLPSLKYPYLQRILPPILVIGGIRYGTLQKKFTVEAAHWLPNLPSGHKCGRLHGHSFHIQIYVRGPLDPHLGWVMEFAEIKTAERVRNGLRSLPGFCLWFPAAGRLRRGSRLL